MTKVSDDFIGRGRFSTVLYTGVVSFEGSRLKSRLVSCLFCYLSEGGIGCDDVGVSTVIWVSGITAMGVP